MLRRRESASWNLAQDLAADPDVPPLATHVEAGAKGGRGNKAGDNVTSFQGNNASYLVRRLKRDYPEIEKRLRLGKHGGDRKSEKVKNQGSSNTTLIGRGAAYNLRRLNRDRPDLAAQVRAGELSANAAAGI